VIFCDAARPVVQNRPQSSKGIVPIPRGHRSYPPRASFLSPEGIVSIPRGHRFYPPRASFLSPEGIVSIPWGYRFYPLRVSFLSSFQNDKKTK
jgi:hypothetical protein